MDKEKPAGEPALKGRTKGDETQRAAREARIKANLRANLHRRKQKARALKEIEKTGDEEAG